MRKNQAMTPHVIAVLVLDGVVPFDLGVPAQVFGSSRTGPERTRLYELLYCGEGTVRTEAGFTVTPDHDLSAVERADTVLIPGIHAGGPVTDGTLPEAVRGRPARRASGRHALGLGETDRRPLSAGRLGFRRAVRGRRRRAHLGRGGRRSRPVPAHRALRPRGRGGQHGGPPVRGAAVA